MPAPATDRARRYGGRSLEERRRERRRRLVDAGLALFGTDGFTNVTIPSLCAHAGVSPRHFYEEFATREELLRAVYDEVIASTHASVQAALTTAADDPRERTRASLDAFLHAYLDDPRRGRIACLEVVGVSAALERHRRSVIHQFAAVIARESASISRGPRAGARFRAVVDRDGRRDERARHRMADARGTADHRRAPRRARRSVRRDPGGRDRSVRLRREFEDSGADFNSARASDRSAISPGAAALPSSRRAVRDLSGTGTAFPSCSGA